MHAQMRDGAVPFVITYRKILEKPKLERIRKFVGPLQLAKNLAVKAIELVENIAFETNTEVLDPGRSVAVHWAVQVEDPWDGTPGREMNLIAYRMLDDVPPCGAHFEILSPTVQPKAREHDAHDHYHEEPEIPATPPEWRRPADEAYAPRPVAPLSVESGDDEPVVILPSIPEDQDDGDGFLTVV